MRKILVAAAGASALVLGTTTVALASKTVQTLASAGSHVVSPVQPLGPAALASRVAKSSVPDSGAWLYRFVRWEPSPPTSW